MRTFLIDGTEYKFEFSFEAVEHKELITRMFNILTGAYVVKAGQVDAKFAVLDGVAEMVADIPSICNVAFYAGLLEHNPVDEKTAKNLLHTYMKDQKKSFAKVFEDFKTYMEEDGFFDLSGLTEMIQKMSAAEEVAKKNNKKK